MVPAAQQGPRGSGPCPPGPPGAPGEDWLSRAYQQRGLDLERTERERAQAMELLIGASDRATIAERESDVLWDELCDALGAVGETARQLAEDGLSRLDALDAARRA